MKLAEFRRAGYRRERVPIVVTKRRLIALICLAAVLLAALTPAVSSAHHAFLVPLDPLFGLVVIDQPLPVVDADSYQSPVLEITGSRPPPTL
jgi:hypothetical protein